MGNLSQANRTGELKTPLGDNVLVLKSFSGGEGLGELFAFHIEALSDADELIDSDRFDKALGKACTIRLKTYEGKERFFCGILTQAQWVGKDPYYHNYKLVLRPWLWLLGNQAGCRIYLDKKVTEIIEDVFKKSNFSNGTHFRFDTTNETYDKIEYCVQYRETDLAFVSRLMEQHGIYYYFEHGDGKHTMVLADGPPVHKAIPDLKEVRFNPATAGYNRPEQSLLTWTSDRRFRTGRVQYNDYDFKSPSKDLRTSKEKSEGYNPAKFEVYDYPGKYDDQGKGEKFARFRLDAEQALDHRRIADGDAPSLFPGGVVTVDKDPISRSKEDYLVVRAQHMFGTQYYAAAHTDRSAPTYAGTFEFQPKDRPFRSLPLTPKPRIYGIQTAKVVGGPNEDSEEISTDKYGRIWVKFYWDKWGNEKADPQKSCPIRVAQKWASKQWGGIHIPRAGMEVVVEYLEGDPDQPLVTGCVYNDDNMPPYGLPDNKTQSGVKSRSTKGGSDSNFNEFMFEDKKGDELVRLQCEKNHRVIVKASQDGSVGGDQTWDIGNNRSWTIEKGNDTMEIKAGDQTINIVLGKQAVNALQSITLSVGKGPATSSIEITPASITLKSPMIKLDASGTGGLITINAPATLFPGPVAIAKGPLLAFGLVLPPLVF
jgi:type VI secretion system secreted protein VgrG